MRIFWFVFLFMAAVNASEKITAPDDLEQRIDKYFKICLTIEQRKLCTPDLKIFKGEQFCDPSVANCYNEVANQRSIKPLYNLWQHIKTDVFSANKTAFIREICRILLVVLEQYVIKLLNTSGIAGQELANTLNNTYSLAQLVDNLENCYTLLSDYLGKLPTTGLKISKKIILIGLAAIIVVQQLLRKISWHQTTSAGSSGSYANMLGSTVYRA